MPDIIQLLQSGAHSPWFYLPVAVLLGALHALEPGHSKGLMASFVIATRGTPAQAALLGGSAAVGHSLVVFVLAALGLWLGDALIVEKAEPWLTFVSGLLIIGLAVQILWMFRHEHHHHHHDHDDDHHHHDHHHDHDDHHDHDHHHHEPARRLSHDEEHALEVQQKFAGRKVGPASIIWFGITAGLMPCPSAVAVLLVCLQSRAITLGFGMVAAFSLGLAITLVSVGLLAAWGARRASEGWSGFANWSEKLPIISALFVMAIGVLITIKGVFALGWV